MHLVFAETRNKQILYIFIVSYLVYSIALIIEFQWIFTDEFFHNRYTDNENSEYVQTLIALNKRSILPNFIIAILVVLIPAYAVAACIWLGFNLIEKEAIFKDCLRASTWANIIFPINYLISVILRVTNILPYDETNINNNFRYQSVVSLIKSDVPDWLVYPLEKINITEFLFVLMLGYFISKVFGITACKATIYAVLFYGCGLLIWIIFTVFLQFTFY